MSIKTLTEKAFGTYRKSESIKLSMAQIYNPYSKINSPKKKRFRRKKKTKQLAVGNEVEEDQQQNQSTVKKPVNLVIASKYDMP